RVTRARSENEIDRGTLEGVDIQSAVLELQKTMTTLQATQASFARLTQLSVFDYLR
ncbi:UNVERIFIED_CONTAM: flagellar biosynthesis protein FlgL, partial [Salmonella enterica subsp. enterica serovar Weltevreden]